MTLTYDNNGNTLTQEDGSGNGVGYTYDAWNRLASNVVEVDGSPTDEGTPQEYGYMPGSQQASYSGCLSTLISDSYYDLGWQLLEKSTWTSSCCGPVVENVQSQYVWGLDYVNDLVERDDSTVSGDLGVEGSNVGERLYAQHDANFNVTAITDTSGAVLERFIYDPYGNQQKLDSSWATATSESVGPYILEFDVGFQGGAVYTDDGTIGPVLTGFQHRDYNPATGRWMQQDPAGYVDGSNRYEFVHDNALAHVDPSGLKGLDEIEGPIDALAHFEDANGAQAYLSDNLIGKIKAFPAYKTELGNIFDKVRDSYLPKVPCVANHQISFIGTLDMFPYRESGGASAIWNLWFGVGSVHLVYTATADISSTERYLDGKWYAQADHIKVDFVLDKLWTFDKQATGFWGGVWKWGNWVFHAPLTLLGGKAFTIHNEWSDFPTPPDMEVEHSD